MTRYVWHWREFARKLVNYFKDTRTKIILDKLIDYLHNVRKVFIESSMTELLKDIGNQSIISIRKEDQIKFGERLLPFSSETHIFPFRI